MKKTEAYLRPVYGSATQKIVRELKKQLKDTPPTHIEPEDLQTYWYKGLNMYFVYPDGINTHSEKKPLENIKEHLKHIKKLGCNGVHILPFLDSPQIDAGFDISNFYKVRPDLGTLQDIKDIVKEAERLGIRTFMDLVFNHISDQHEWFQKAENGDQKYRNYFLHSETRPKLVRTYSKENALYAEYSDKGKLKSSVIVFPEAAGDLPHWRLGKDGYWYYHTFYPEQIDLNWHNPDVFIEMAKVVMYWTKIGFHFRLDANRYIGKPIYKQDNVYWDSNHLITAALKEITHIINPENAFLVESYEDLDTVISYFGTSNQVESNLNYNFHLCTNIWLSLIGENANFMWNKLEKLDQIPKHAEWVNFLRNHDELSLSFVSDKMTKRIKKKLVPRGKEFREGLGISGRTFSFLQKSKKRLLMAYFLLASFPGAFCIPYGDEVGSVNVSVNKLSVESKKDTRNINRGVLGTKYFNSKKAKDIFSAISHILSKRKILSAYLNVWPVRVSNPLEIFSAVYKLGTSELLVLINLSDKEKEIKMDTVPFELIAEINAAKVTKDAVILRPYAGVWMQK